MENQIFDLSLYPEKPGVYLMKNDKGQVIYIGKAKNLKNRLRQYFQKQDTRIMIPFLLSSIASIETILCFTEKEALLLENTLIKKHQPKYNALLKDDKSYICLFIDPKHQWPRLELVRSKEQKEKKGIYFGPYSVTQAAREAYKILSEHFGLRQCSDYEFNKRSRPCLLYGMKKCLAPCKNLCSTDDYQKSVSMVIKFLQGESKEILNILKEKIQKASDELAFEQAAAFYKALKQLETIVYSKQMMIQANQNDMDIFNLYQEGSKGTLVKLLYRQGKITGQDIMHFEDTLDEGATLLTRLFLQHYEITKPAPIILCPLIPEDEKALADIIKEISGTKICFQVPLKGDKKAFLQMAYENAKQSFHQVKNDEDILIELQDRAKLSHFPETIECFDLSHFSGSEPVAVKIRIENGKIHKAGKRLFKIKTVPGGDDYGGMKEVLIRSLTQSKKENIIPNLLLIDGGKGQVNIAKQVVDELDIISCEIIGLVKEASRHDKGLSQERLVVSHQEEPLELDKKSPLLFFLQKIRDEAHRAAITFNQKRQKTRTIKSALDDIKGIGEVKKKSLLKHFGSLEQIKKATEEELSKVSSINHKDVLAIKNFFKNT